MNRGRLRNVGFSLPELIVVMGIILILLVLAVSFVRAARNSANGALCATNLRQIGQLIHAYAADNGGEIPAVYGHDSQGNLRPMAWVRLGAKSEGDGIGGMLLLVSRPIGMAERGYVQNANIFICPNDPDISRRQDPNDFIPIGSKGLRRMSYTYCYVPSSGDSFPYWMYGPVAGQSGQGGTWPQWTRGALAGFRGHNLNQPNAASTAVLYEPPVFHRVDLPSILVHGAGGNVLYMDGHVVEMSQRDIPLHPWDGSFDEIKERLSILDQ